MQREDIWNVDTARTYDTPGRGMFSPEVLEPTVDFLVELAGTGRVLEFAVGTGRVAIELVKRGIEVTGIELSRPMIDQLRTKIDESSLPVLEGDMAHMRAPGSYSLVYLVYNTISNLLSQDEQIDCFRNAARHLDAGGRFVVELGVPQLRRLPPGQDAIVFRNDDGYMGVDTYDVLRQRMISHHFRFKEDGTTRLLRSPHRYIWPSELDLMARLAGFRLESRRADWTGAAFGAESYAHVSVYVLRPPRSS